MPPLLVKSPLSKAAIFLELGLLSRLSDGWAVNDLDGANWNHIQIYPLTSKLASQTISEGESKNEYYGRNQGKRGLGH